MKTPPDTPEFARFTEAMQQILSVSKEDLQKRMDAEKQERRQTAKASSSGRASCDRD